MRHTVIISDIHLWDAVPDEGVWMRYRQRQFFPDAEIAAMLDRLLSEVDRGSLELVFNGDLFDFDVAPVVEGRLRFGDPPRSETVAVERLARILDDHPLFIAAVARVLAAGHRVVFVSGNHDAELCWPLVRDSLSTRLLTALAESDGVRVSDGIEARSRIAFRSWFHRTSDGIHVEHGNQYDRFCSIRYPMEPFTPDGTRVQPTSGSLVVRYLVGRLGFFNPNVDSSFDLNAWGFARHWAKYYLFSRHSLVATWLTGAVRVAIQAFAHRDAPNHARERRHVAAAASETRVEPAALEEHAKLFELSNAHEVARALCVDRAALMALGASAVLLGLALPRAAIGFGAGAASAFALFNVFVPTADLNRVYGGMQQRMREIARIHDARAVVFGHTHHPGGEWEDGVFYGNSGTWAPSFRDPECEIPVGRGRPVIWLRTGSDGLLRGGFHTWIDGSFVAGEREVTQLAPRSQVPQPPVTEPAQIGVELWDDGGRLSVA